MPCGGAAVRGRTEHGDPAGAAPGADGMLAPARQGRPAGSGVLGAHIDALTGWVDADGDITMPELAARLLAERGIKAHPASLSRLLIQHGFTVKKNAARERNRSR
ncbi:hypothetical protein [Sphingobium sp.]|uniref:hypothetical protein n=1 Tax=Sphingobium sp. TaxID=1912891 RepID=UPI0039B97ABE